MSVVIVYLINECTYVYYHHGYEFDGAPSTYHRRGTFSLHLYIYMVLARGVVGWGWCSH